MKDEKRGRKEKQRKKEIMLQNVCMRFMGGEREGVEKKKKKMGWWGY